MDISKKRVWDAFAEYTSHYNISDEKIKLKVDHTYRVANLCERIAGSNGLSEEDVLLSWLTGMLHDVGRFEQIKNFGTFSDADSIDHAHYGIKVLFEDKKLADYIDIDVEAIEKYLEAKKMSDGDVVLKDKYEDIDIIYKAIWNHSAYRIEEGLDDRTVMFCDILRDADKIDILKVNHDIPMEEIYNVTTEQLKNEVVTEEVMKQFFEKHAVLRGSKKTSVDHIVGHAALVFELVYPESLHIVEEQGYLKKLLEFESDNPVTNEQFKKLAKFMEEFID